MKKILGLFILAMLLIVGWFFASPYYTVYQLKNAYDSHNAAVINAHIDFSRVQRDLKQQLQPVLIHKIQALTQSPFAKLLNIQVDETAIVEKLVNQAVESVTPSTVETLLTTQGNMSAINYNVKLLGGLTAVAMDKIQLTPETLAELATAKNSDELNQKLLTQVKASTMTTGSTPLNAKPTAHYCGINCFEVQTQVQGYPLKVALARHGFANWQIVKVTLPI